MAKFIVTEGLMAASITCVGQLELSYDRDADVLYISIGTPRPAYSHAEDHGLLLRKDPENGDLVGATILDYEEHFCRLPDLSWLAATPLPEEIIAYLRERPTLPS